MYLSIEPSGPHFSLYTHLHPTVFRSFGNSTSSQTRPKVGHLRVFGCDAFAHIPKDERHKLDAKARKCIFLGYEEETKGYRLYDTTRGRVFYSRDVGFNEIKLERILESNEPDTEFLVELDLSNESEASSKDTEDIQEELPNDNTAEPTLRRSERGRRPPDFYGVKANTVGELQKEPASIEDVLQSTKRDKWMNAMEQEMKLLIFPCFKGSHIFDCLCWTTIFQVYSCRQSLCPKLVG